MSRSRVDRAADFHRRDGLAARGHHQQIAGLSAMISSEACGLALSTQSRHRRRARIGGQEALVRTGRVEHLEVRLRLQAAALSTNGSRAVPPSTSWNQAQFDSSGLTPCIRITGSRPRPAGLDSYRPESALCMQRRSRLAPSQSSGKTLAAPANTTRSPILGLSGFIATALAAACSLAAQAQPSVSSAIQVTQLGWKVVHCGVSKGVPYVTYVDQGMAAIAPAFMTAAFAGPVPRRDTHWRQAPLGARRLRCPTRALTSRRRPPRHGGHDPRLRWNPRS